MDTIVRITNILKSGERTARQKYYIPEAWNYFGYTDYERNPARPKEILVCPFHFFRSCLERQILGPMETTGFQTDTTEKGNVTEQIIYGMFPRSFTAWTHGHSSQVYAGSFLKSMALLPLLKKLGVDVVYLLPVLERGTKYHKGELGSPYAIRNHYRLDSTLNDPLLRKAGIGAEEEFKAFVEACHCLGMKVMLDFVFRTASRDHDLIMTHPEWFYWIEHRYNADFTMPHVENAPDLSAAQGKNLKKLYSADGVETHLRKFTFPPSVLDPRLWEEVKERQKHTGENILTLIEEAFGITTVPGFSNVINDPQPPWLDVTYLKLYYDLHSEARTCLGRKRGPHPDDDFHGYAPFIMQDGACANVHRGKVPNKELWDYLIGVVPHYQKTYGIDGARIDMGHALPPELLRAIIKAIKAVNPEFLLWSEEFNYRNAPRLKRDGFHFITGSLWAHYKHFAEKDFLAEALRRTCHSQLPVTAALEMPDTPRLAFYYQDKRRIEALVLLNYLIPNSVPFLNNGLELLERQPMNLGLDNTEAGRYVLDKDDPMYGKLAFFDNYCLHWLDEDYEWMSALLRKAKHVRTHFISLIKEKGSFLTALAKQKRDDLLKLGYYSPREKRGFILLVNKDLVEATEVVLKKELPRPFRAGEINVFYRLGELTDINWPVTKTVKLEPGEVIILQTGKEEAM